MKNFLNRRRTQELSESSSSSIQDPDLVHLTQSDQLSGARLALDLADTTSALHFVHAPPDAPLCISALCYNAIIMEIRDMFRLMNSLRQRAKEETLVLNHIHVFYQWFEGFFEIITCVFDTEEDILFPYLLKVASIKLDNSLCEKRRQTKKTRAKDLCWDILELKIQFDHKSEKNVDLSALVEEMFEEVHHLSARLASYFQRLKDVLPDIIESNFNLDERRLIDSSYIGNLRASDAGKFVISAFSRGYWEQEKKLAFLEESLRSSKTTKSSISKQIRRFQRNHTDLVKKMSIPISETDS